MQHVMNSCCPAAFSDTSRNCCRTKGPPRSIFSQFERYQMCSRRAALLVTFSTLGCWFFPPTLYVYMLIAGLDHAQWLWVCNMQRLAASFMSSLERSLFCTCVGFALKWPFSKVFGWSLEEHCTGWFSIGIGQWKRRTYLFIKFSLSNEFTSQICAIEIEWLRVFNIVLTYHDLVLFDI